MSQRKLFVYGIDTRSRLCELVDLFEQYGRILRVECPPPRVDMLLLCLLLLNIAPVEMQILLSGHWMEHRSIATL